jgi:hypothetical protein
MPRKTLIQNRRDTAANWTSVNPILASGEIGVETDTNKFKLGDGTSTWTQLDYQTGTQGPAGPTGPQGPQGPQGEPGTGGTASFTYTQNTAASIWDITHNLGFHPNVATVDSAGSSIEGVLTYTGINTLTVVFSIATTGTAYLS